MIIKYRTGGYGHNIERVEVLRETEKTVWIKSSYSGCDARRETKWSVYHKYHDSWDAAHAYLQNVFTQKLETRKRDVENAREDLAKISAMVDPEATP